MDGCQRSVLSCARCRRRKIKCDRKLPSCSGCIRSQSSCTGVQPGDDGSSAAVPRSLVQHLESEIADLEVSLAQGKLSESPSILRTLSSFTSIPVREAKGYGKETPSNTVEPKAFHKHIMNSDNFVRTVCAVSNFREGVESNIKCGAIWSSLRNTSKTSRHHGKDVENENNSVFPIMISKGIYKAQNVSLALNTLDQFFHHIWPQHPFLEQNTLRQQFIRVTEGDSAADFDIFCVYTVMAITVASNQEEVRKGPIRCMAFSRRLFEAGIRKFDHDSSISSDITSVQRLLLTLLYALSQPSTINVSMLSGAAVRLCLDSGFHREILPPHHLSDTALRLRQRVFWSSWGLERSISNALHRAVCFSDAAINIPYPDHDPICRRIEFEKLRSSAIQVHFHNESLPAGLNWESWVSYMEQKLEDWHNSPPPGNQEERTREKLRLLQGLFTLHRPSLRAALPSTRSALAAFKHAAEWILLFQTYLESHTLFQPWLIIRDIFDAAVVAFYSLKRATLSIRRIYQASQIANTMEAFTKSLSVVGALDQKEWNTHAIAYQRHVHQLLEVIELPESELEDEPYYELDEEMAVWFWPDSRDLRILSPSPTQNGGNNAHDLDFLNQIPDIF